MLLIGQMKGERVDPDYEAIISLLEREFPALPTLVAHDSAFQLLVAVILTASTTDAQVNRVTPALFAQYPDARAMARCPDPHILQAIIHSVGLAPAKARYIHQTARIVDQQHNGMVPLDFDSLVLLPGVGRKTAHVVLCNLTDTPGVIVDTHYARVVRRIGLSSATTPSAIENDTTRVIRQGKWCSFSRRINLLGKKWCTARAPQCVSCPIRDHCQFFFKASLVRNQ